MKKIETTAFKNSEIADFANQLLKNGFKIMIPTEGEKSYFFFEKDGKLGYTQQERFNGFRFSTVHKPCIHAGTGYSLGEEENYEPSVKDAEACLVDYPRWVSSRDRLPLAKHKSLEEYQKKETVLKYEIYYPFN